MEEKRKYILKSGGYVAFFIAALVVSVFITFDAQSLKPLIKNQARKNNLDVRINEISLNPLIGLDITGIRIMPLQTGMQTKSGSVQINGLSLEVPPTKIPAIVLSALSEKRPTMAVEFHGEIGKGKIKGTIEQTDKSFFLEMEARSVPVEKIDLAGSYLKGMKITGVLNCEVNLDFKDFNQPKNWEGNIMATIDQPAFSDFEYASYNVAGITMKQGMLSAELENGKVNINKIKLEGDDLPVDLSGEISLKNPLRSSVIDLKGKIDYSSDYQDKMPLIKAFIPSTDSYHYQNALGKLIPGL